MKLHQTIGAAALGVVAATVFASEARAQEPAAAATDTRLRIVVTDEAGTTDTLEYVRLVRGDDGQLYIVDPELAMLQVRVTPVEPAQGYEAGRRPGDTTAVDTAAAAQQAGAAGARAPTLVITKDPLPGMAGPPAGFRDNAERVQVVVPTGEGQTQTLDYRVQRDGDGYRLVPPDRSDRPRKTDKAGKADDAEAKRDTSP